GRADLRPAGGPRGQGEGVLRGFDLLRRLQLSAADPPDRHEHGAGAGDHDPAVGEPDEGDPAANRPGEGHPHALLRLRQVSDRPSANRLPWLKVALVGGALVVGAGVGIGVAIANGSSSPGTPKAAPNDPGITWPARDRRAPDFTLRDQAGSAISL